MDELHQAHGRCLDLIEGSIAACSRQTHSLNNMYTCFSNVSPSSKARLPKLRPGKQYIERSLTRPYICGAGASWKDC